MAKKAAPIKLHIESRRLFHEAARNMRVCVMCGKGGPFQAHHVLYEQHLRDRGLPRYNSMNSLRICNGCHQLHHKGAKRIPVRKLRHDNLLYLVLELGSYAFDYLNIYYDHSEQDPRVVELMERAA